MPYGFERYTANSGKLVISDNFLNVSLISKQSISNFSEVSDAATISRLFPALGDKGKIYQFTFTVGASLTNWLVAHSLSQNKIAVLEVIKSSATALNVKVYVTNDSNLSSSLIYVFASGATSGKNYGRQIFNALTGVCCFDSNLKYMRVIGTHEQKNNAVTTVPAGKTLAMLPCAYNIESASIEDSASPSPNPNSYVITIISTSTKALFNTCVGTTVTTLELSSSSTSGGNELASRLPRTAIKSLSSPFNLIIDVTNY
ncbi:hypothetical protein IAE19_03055 [Acinetobacter sp. S40]|uniref:hypothetical protein n=1 Tax=Acinetobacter sp. S40 TaxID=2767434 RepID=UPI00190A5FA0|nr:hypothetical protein [Acinetobacter sp. S40]MBJ9984419.1 hypothetical protein [Acinetobacter sp. S40]